jgi:hypothetical protein
VITPSVPVYVPWFYTELLVQEITDMINRWQVHRRASQEDGAVNKDYGAGDKIVFCLQMSQRR